jgi:hypothetical protein
MAAVVMVGLAFARDFDFLHAESALTVALEAARRR